MSRDNVISKIYEKKVIAIVRGFYGEQCLELAKALADGGIGLLEVTFDPLSEENRMLTCRTIELLRTGLDGRMLFGAGTVLSPDTAELAASCGAEYIVAPNTDRDVIEKGLDLNMVCIPGALTPTEIQQAHLWGADFVKVFPASDMGVSYFKKLHAPLIHVPMLAVGGVNENNINDYLNAGAAGAGVAGCLFKKEWVLEGRFDLITERGLLLNSVLEAGK